MFTLINIDTYDSSLISKILWIKMKSSIENTLKTSFLSFEDYKKEYKVN